MSITMSINNQKIHRYYKDTEYEIKLNLKNKDKSLEDYLFDVENIISKSNQYDVDKVQTKTQMKTHFFADNSNEYSIFRYENKVMLKIKNHNIVQNGLFPIFCNTETFLYELGEIKTKIANDNVQYMGNMIKNRIKDFIIDTNNGLTYSLAITICESNGVKQHQLEVEYYGHLESHKPPQEPSEKEIQDNLVKLTNYIYEANSEDYCISTERKYEFVLKNRSTIDKADKKYEILSNLTSV